MGLQLSCARRLRARVPLTPEQSARARRRWSWAVDNVQRLTVLRRRWHWLGEYLKSRKTKALFGHLKRRVDELLYKRPAAVQPRINPMAPVVEPKAKSQPKAKPDPKRRPKAKAEPKAKPNPKPKTDRSIVANVTIINQ